MEIFLNEIPEEGLHRSGQFPASLFELDATDSIQPCGPVDYDVQIYRFDDLVAFSGWLRGRFKLQCAVCLEYVESDARFDNWSSDLELEEGQISFDLAQVIREEFLLELPASPFCEDVAMDQDRVCPKADLIADMKKAAEKETEPDEGPNQWGALDDLK